MCLSKICHNKIHSKLIPAIFMHLLLLFATATISANSTAAPIFVEPLAGSTLSDTEQTFTWSLNNTDVERWWLYVGSSVGARDYANSGDLGQDTEYDVIGIPADGSIVHARLWYFITGRWLYIDSSFTAANLDLEATTPAIISHANYSNLTGTSAQLEWRDNNTLVNFWWLYVGSSTGANDLYDSGRSLQNRTSVTVDQLPVDGSTVYIRLWYRTSAEGWQYVDTEYSTGTNDSLVNAGDLKLLGSFRVPQNYASTEERLSFGGNALAYNPANNSLFLAGHDRYGRTAEISIPTAIKADTIADLEFATFLQTPVDATAGKLPLITDPPETVYARIGGHLVAGNELIVSAYDRYDGSDEQIASHFTRSIDLQNQANVVGPIALSSTTKARWLGGPMALIPSNWQGAFGHTFIGGLAGISISINASVGPAAAAFSRDTLDGNGEANLLVGYPLEYALHEPHATSALWNLTAKIRGMAFPEGTDSILFFGSIGIGEYCYGTPEECNDPIKLVKGSHAPPYINQIWAYTADDLLSVADGTNESWEIQPYSTWEIELPFTTAIRYLGGVAYDPSTQRIFIAQREADNSNRPLIHVYKLPDL